MPPIAALIIVILNCPGTSRAMNSASTLVSGVFRYTLAVAAVISKSVSSAGGTSPSSRCHVTAGVSIRLMPPVDSRMPVIQLVRRASPSVNTRMPASRCRAMFSKHRAVFRVAQPPARSASPVCTRPAPPAAMAPQQAADVLSVSRVITVVSCATASVCPCA